MRHTKDACTCIGTLSDSVVRNMYGERRENSSVEADQRHLVCVCLLESLSKGKLTYTL